MIDVLAEYEAFERGVQGVSRYAINCVCRAMSDRGLNKMDPDAIQQFIREHTDEELLQIRLLGRRSVEHLRTWVAGEPA